MPGRRSNDIILETSVTSDQGRANLNDNRFRWQVKRIFCVVLDAGYFVGEGDTVELEG